MDRLRMGAALLAPGAAIFSLRAVLVVLGQELEAIPGLGLLTAAGGVLSLVGIIVVVWALGLTAVAGAACVLVGHFALSPSTPALGAGLVYLGTGLAVAARTRAAATAGTVALVGALVREGSWTGHALVAVGAGWLALELAWLAWRRRAAAS